MTSQDLLKQFFEKAQKGATVVAHRNEYWTMISGKQYSWLASMYRKERKDWDDPVNEISKAIGDWDVIFGRCSNGAYKLTWLNRTIKNQ